MPPLQLNKLLGALRFQSKGLTLPAQYDFVTPPDRESYMNSLPPQDRVAIPRLIPQWFKPALPIKPHQLMCDTIGQSFKDMHDLFCDAIVYGHNLWRMQAKFTPIPIVGPSVAGPPGCLTGPNLGTLAKQCPAMARMTGFQTAYRDAVLDGIGTAFNMWQVSVTIPGLPMYPAYVMQPPGSAIPAPNVPQKLIACVAPGMSAILVPDIMKGLMRVEFQKTGVAADEATDAFFDALATVLSLGFANWLANQMVIGLTGSGAVASPVGGPVAGVTLPTPGHLAC